MSAAKILLRALLVVGALILAIAAFLALSTIADYVFGGDRVAALTNITIPGDPPVRAWFTGPPGEGPYPAVIMIHEAWGLRNDIVGKAESLAAEGYFVIAPDLFRGSSTSWMPRAIHQMVSNSAAQVNHDLDAVADWLAARPDVVPGRIAVTGFCFGGRASLSFSLHRGDLAATAIFYGSPIADAQALRALRGPVLGIFGGADLTISTDQVRAFERALGTAGVPNRILIYDDQPHAFVSGMEEIRAGGPAAEAWTELLRFLDQTLRGPHPVEAIADSPSAAGARPPAVRARYYLALAWEHIAGGASHRPHRG
jgi:carboxymethylenebutenolidase